ncbi:FG-GAP-like repeat-containing protein [Gimesia algae]|uniref:ASPIC and UnbV n=1 Tax=Gimesia algae TaxID=2527971 RepID=A0A517VGF1_9PLAN|nr:FG-GAP-like repeat-containing protein [Gimesia algae]QDT92091.1 ASPIC and UnbV [Gimesia algae]
MIWIGVIFLAVGVAVYFSGLLEQDPDAVFQRASYAFRMEKFEEAKQFVDQLLDSPSHQVPAAMLGAEIAIKERNPVEAIQYYEHVPDNGSREALKARIRSGELYLFQLNQLSKSQDEFLRAQKSFPDDPLVLERLSYLYGLTARSWEAIPVRLKLLQQDRIDPLVLYLLAMSDRSLENPQLISEYAAAAPDDPLVQLVQGRLEIDRQEYTAAEKRLLQLVSTQPELSQAQVLLGQILLQKGDERRFKKWQESLSDHVRKHPDIWSIEGQWYQQQGQRDSAILCFAEALKRDSTNSTSCYQLGQLLFQTENENAKFLLEYAKKLQEYEGLVKVVYGDKDLQAAKQLVVLAKELGLLWEAYGWSRASRLLDPQLAWAQATESEIKPVLANLSLTRMIADRNPVSYFQLPQQKTVSGGNTPGKLNQRIDVQVVSSISFEEVAEAAGISFQYFNGHAWPDTAYKMYEFTGGGVGILDFNADGWPDIYLTQGTSWPVNGEQKQYYDRLFTNQGNGTFRDVTSSTGIFENQFSQGVTIGDLNNDGFDDIYVGNIGLNQLYLNNGDGTYSKSDQAQGSDRDWTTSCLIADLNGDGGPEIYAVNYLTADDVFDRVCQNADGSERSCMPLNFPGAQDQLFENLNNGQFENITSSSGIQVAQGKGLGIIVADLKGNGFPDLFIANDAVANFFMVNQGTRKTTFQEEALLSGLALNAQGRTEACMGIAAGDADADGLLDFYVTNYYRETNTLYRQMAPDAFIDETQSAKLSDTTRYQLGFGTQFLDADLDGLLDLLIVNGHVEDLSAEDVPWQMQPQLMLNRGKGVFLQLQTPGMGSFFKQKRLGRGLARVDWNRDGREEAVVTSLDQPVALLKNTTEPHGHRLVVTLTGTKSSRDAIGTTVRLKAKDQTLFRQLTAGDGYQARNQRNLFLGTGERTADVRLEVSWPSGLKQVFEGIAIDQEIQLIEGQTTPVVKRIFE